jgi:mRNA-degrading endonuclease RelE of RelBE toxin-antitoxin system
MDKIEKLLRKISKKDRAILESTISSLISGSNVAKISKIKDTEFYKIRNKNFRIIFHYENKELVIDDVRLRKEKTYKNLK